MKRPVILCVDDEEMVLSSLEIELRNNLGRKFTIETAESGEDAIELLTELIANKYEIFVVISDYIMPGIKGDELLEKIHNILPNTLTIMLTGQSNADAIANAVNNAKLYRYITKPWQKEDMSLTVEGAVKSYQQNKELEKKIATFEKFVPSQFLKILNLDAYDDIKLGNCVEREMTVLFCDIRSFTALSEQMTPKENFSFINSYLSEMGPIIRLHNGFIDKYIGDAIMALFENADDAVQAGIEMLSKLKTYNQARARDGYSPIGVGIGINTGYLMLGTVGENDRMETTVIGDMVNLASRVESLNKIYGTNLLITDQTYLGLKVPLDYHIRVIDAAQVKGKSDPITIYEIFDADPPDIIELKEKTSDDFEVGFVLYHSEENYDALMLFKKVLEVNNNDNAARIYLERLLKKTIVF